MTTKKTYQIRLVEVDGESVAKSPPEEPEAAFQLRVEGLPEQISVVGMPQQINVVGMPEQISLRMPEKTPTATADASATRQTENRELWKFEYERAQGMLQHYDNLSWHIGSIFIAGIAVLTGLGLGKDGFETLAKGWRSLVIVFGIPGVSLLILLFWAFWFRRHRALYRMRDDVLHRLELDLGFYHFLRTAEANRVEKILKDARRQKLKLSQAIKKKGRAVTLDELEKHLTDEQKTKLEFSLPEITKLLAARKAAYEKDKAEANAFKSMVDIEYSGPASYKLVWCLTTFIPLVQFLVLFLLWWAHMNDRRLDIFKPLTWKVLYGEASTDLVSYALLIPVIVVGGALLLLWSRVRNL